MTEKRRRSTITLVLPARNEAGGIAGLLRKAQPCCDELLVVDGHSTDGTAALAAAAGAQVVSDHGKGKGDAYAVGLAHATMDIVVFMDADGSHHPEDIPRVVAPIRAGAADLVIASRHRGGSDEWEGDVSTWLRAIGSGLLSLAINYRFGTGLTDVLNGFRAIRADLGRSIQLRAVDFDVEQHMVCQVLKAGGRVVEVGAHEYRRGWGESKLPTYRKAYLFFTRLALDLLPSKVGPRA